MDKLDGNNMIVNAIIIDKNTTIYGLAFLGIEQIHQLKRQKLQAIFNFLPYSYMIYNLSKFNFIYFSWMKLIYHYCMNKRRRV